MNILFICSRNQWRSPTAEAIYKNYSGLNVKSAGTEPSARIRINLKLINWADIIFVMEKKHKQRLEQNFQSEMSEKQIINLEIEDNYKFMDAELIEEVKTKVSAYINFEQN